MRYIFLFLTLFSFLFSKFPANSDVKLRYWQAVKGNSTIYFVGTMHAKDKRVKLLMPKIKELINKSDFIYTEIAITPLSTIIVFQKTIRDDNKSLEDILPKELYKELDIYLKKIHPLLSAKKFDKFKIWAITAMLEVLKDELYNKNIEPLDKEIFITALKEAKNVGGVENINEQIEIFDTLSLEEQINQLQKTLEVYKKYPNSLDNLKDYYFSANYKKLETLFNKLSKEYEDRNFLDKILYKRNIKMANRIDKLVSKYPNKSFLFAFGVMHFLGEKSVIELLQSKGYNIIIKTK